MNARPRPEGIPDKICATDGIRKGQLQSPIFGSHLWKRKGGNFRGIGRRFEENGCEAYPEFTECVAGAAGAGVGGCCCRAGFTYAGDDTTIQLLAGVQGQPLQDLRSSAVCKPCFECDPKQGRCEKYCKKALVLG